MNENPQVLMPVNQTDFVTNYTDQHAHLLGTRAVAEAVSLGGLFGVGHSKISVLLLVCGHVQSLSLKIQRILNSFQFRECTL